MFLSVSVDMEKNTLLQWRGKKSCDPFCPSTRESITVNFCHVLAVCSYFMSKAGFSLNVPDSYTLLDKSVHCFSWWLHVTAQPCTSFCLNSEQNRYIAHVQVFLPGRVYIYSGKQKEMIACDSIFSISLH